MLKPYRIELGNSRSPSWYSAPTPGTAFIAANKAWRRSATIYGVASRQITRNYPWLRSGSCLGSRSRRNGSTFSKALVEFGCPPQALHTASWMKSRHFERCSLKQNPVMQSQGRTNFKTWSQLMSMLNLLTGSTTQSKFNVKPWNPCPGLVKYASKMRWHWAKVAHYSSC